MFCTPSLTEGLTTPGKEGEERATTRGLPSKQLAFSQDILYYIISYTYIIMYIYNLKLYFIMILCNIYNIYTYTIYTPYI